MAYNTVSVGTGATLIVAANSGRIGLLLANTSSGTVYVGDDSSVSTSNGFPLKQDAQLSEDSGGTKIWPGAVYGVVASGTSDVRYWERTRVS